MRFPSIHKKLIINFPFNKENTKYTFDPLRAEYDYSDYPLMVEFGVEILRQWDRYAIETLSQWSGKGRIPRPPTDDAVYKTVGGRSYMAIINKHSIGIYKVKNYGS
jgi:hypothetical protein